jgi:hypothetical protein
LIGYTTTRDAIQPGEITVPRSSSSSSIEADGTRVVDRAGEVGEAIFGSEL